MSISGRAVPSAVSVVAAGFLALQLARPVWDVDIFWQLRLGELTLAHGLPHCEPFLAGRDGEPLAVVAWLGQAVYAAVRQVTGWPGLRAFDAVVWLGGFWAVAVRYEARARTGLLACVGFGVAWVAAVPFASVRPQSLAVLSFGLLVVLLRSGRTPRVTLPLAAGLLVLWQNLHPSAAVAAGYLAARAAGEWLAFFFGRGPRPSAVSAVLAPLAAAATLATPAGFSIYAVSAANRDRCVWDELQITEWYPVWDFFPDGGRLQGVACMAATLVAAAVTRRQQTLVAVVPFLALTAASVMTHRFIVFWGVAAVPVWAAVVAGSEPRAVSRPRWIGAAAAAAVAVCLAIMTGNHFSPTLPIDAVRHLSSVGVVGPVYCPYTFGGVVADGGYPNLKPTHDGRYYLFTREQLRAHHSARRGEVPVAELEGSYRPVAFLLPPDEGLVGVLDRPDSGWVREYSDRAAVAFVRRSR